MSSGPSWEWEARVGGSRAHSGSLARDEDRLAPLLLAGRSSVLGTAQQSPGRALGAGGV